MEIASILTLLLLLQVKHLFADYYLQTGWMLSARDVYVHPGRAAHCGVHAVGTLICFLIMGVGFWIGLLLLIVEFVLHYHIDFGKGRWGEMKGHGPEEASYWRAFGFDQALHHATYVIMVWLLV